MRTFFIGFAFCLLAVGDLRSQTNALVISDGIPQELHGEYVLISRTCPVRGKAESFKDHSQPFCAIKSNSVVLADGKILHSTGVHKFESKQFPSLTVDFEGVGYMWTFSSVPPVTAIVQTPLPHRGERRIRLADMWAHTNSVTVGDSTAVSNQLPVICVFEVRKTEGKSR